MRHGGGLHLDGRAGDSAFVGAGTGTTSRPGRPSVRLPAPARGTVEKNYWRFDPNISWYGPGFYGNGTACGQTLTKELVGVAHRTLPCGTIVTFRYNGKTVSSARHRPRPVRRRPHMGPQQGPVHAPRPLLHRHDRVEARRRGG